MDEHRCHAKGCPTQISASNFMCPEHWHILSADLRRRVWRHYQKGNDVENLSQEVSKEAQEAVEKKLFERCLQNHGPACGCWAKEPIVADGP